MKISILTNFGCHYSCPYCITKSLNCSFEKTTVDDLDNLSKVIEENKNLCDGLSISGGGDPLFNIKENVDFYDRLFEIVDAHKTKIDLHTSLILPSSFDKFYHANKFNKIVFHLNAFKELYSIERKSENQKIRAVFVVDSRIITEDLLFKIANFVKRSDSIDELSFRQKVMDNGLASFYLDDILKKHDNQLWKYIVQDDYNFYYHKNKIYRRFFDFSESLKNSKTLEDLKKEENEMLL